MAKYYGTIGFVDTVEIPLGSGIWKEVITERKYIGEVIRNSRKWQASQTLNDDLNISNEIVIVMDEYAIKNFHALRYIEYMGAYWKISNVLVEHPHLRLTIGGVYNRQEPTRVTCQAQGNSWE